VAASAAEVVGTAEGSSAALRYIDDAMRHVSERLAEAEREGWSTFTYVYTAHPNKDMHALGVDHPEVSALIKGLDARLARLWSNDLVPLDASLVVTADHGHISVPPGNMVTLPAHLIECLEYANIGIYGQGRHGIFHCRAGRQADFVARWHAEPQLHESFVLLSVEDAVAERLFGPTPPLPEVRPRLGDYIALAISLDTLVTPSELRKHKHRAQGSHGSLLPAEMEVPYVCLTPFSHGRKRPLRGPPDDGGGKVARHNGEGLPHDRQLQERMHAVRLARLQQEIASTAMEVS